MRTLIVGAGAMGNYFAASMKRAGIEVVLYDINQVKVDTINQQGIKVLDGEDQWLAQVPIYADIDEVPTPELIIILVKSYATERAAREIMWTKDEDTLVLTLQDGLGNAEEIEKHIPKRQVFVGVTYQNAYEVEPGVVKNTGSGLTIVAPRQKAALPSAMALARLFNNCRIAAGATSDIEPILWKKLIVSSAIGPLSAIYELPSGKLPKNPDAVRDMMELVLEGVMVAQKVNVPLDYGEMWATVLETCRTMADNLSAMLLDVQNGRSTEINAINGSIIRIAETYGIDTPANVRVLRSVTAKRKKQQDRL